MKIPYNQKKNIIDSFRFQPSTDKGVWLSASDGAVACDVQNSTSFKSKIGIMLKSKKLNNSNKKKNNEMFFVPLRLMFNEFLLEKYEGVAGYYDEDAEELDDMFGNTLTNGEFTQEENSDLEQLKQELTKARIDQIKSSTVLSNQKILEKKNELFSEWNMRYFEVFSKNFQILKNELVKLHLNQEQVETLNNIIDICVKNFEIAQDEISEDFLENIEESEE